MLRQLGEAGVLAAIPSLALLTALASPISCASARRVSPQDIVEVGGIIRDREGIGVPGMDVFLDPADDDRTSGTAVTTDRKGEFRTRVRRGPYRWILFSRHARIPTVLGDTVQLTERHERLDYRYGGLKVEGRILGPNGLPMKAGSVVASGTDPQNRMGIDVTGVVENGRYRMFLPASSYWFHANPWPERYAKIEGVPQVRISADTTIDFTIAGHLVTGRVTLGRSKPLRGAEVKAAGGGDLLISARDKTRGDGRFELYLPSGGYGIVLWPGPGDGHIAPRFYPLTVDGPQTISLDAAGVVWRGTVRDSTTRSPLRSVKVVAKNIQLSIPLVCKTDGRGRFKFVLEPGRKYALTVGYPRFDTRGEEVSGVLAGHDSTFDLYVDNSRESTTGAR